MPNAVIVSILTTQRREEEKIMNTKPGIIGKKLGMTHLYKEDGTVMRVTVVDTSDVLVVGKRTPEKDGYKVLATDEGVERAFKKLDTIKGDIVWWKAGAQPPQLLASGEVVMTSVYNGRIDTASIRQRHDCFGGVALCAIDRCRGAESLSDGEAIVVEIDQNDLRWRIKSCR